MGTLEAVRRRVLPHLVNLRQVDFDLETFAVNCYLQGLRDMSETVINNPSLAIGGAKPPVLEYTI